MRCSTASAWPPYAPSTRLVVALARWDRLKDPVGILDAFARHVDEPRAFLVPAGPATRHVADDTEGVREAHVIVKKSLQEGFGLGVTDGMWKAKPVVATRVGGHRDQIEHRRSGVLVDDPADLSGFATAIDEVLADPGAARELGTAARERVRERCLADRHFISWMEVLRRLPAPA